MMGLIVIEEELSRKGSDVNEFIRMFLEADVDWSGIVSWAEFKCGRHGKFLMRPSRQQFSVTAAFCDGRQV